MRLQTPDESSSSPVKCLRRMEVISRYLKKGAVGAELGVFKGSFLDHLLSTGPQILYAVDPWYRVGPRWRWADGEQSTVRALRRILEVFEEEISAGRLVPRVEFSQDFLASLEDRHLDWVYIDTTHTFEQTLLELTLCLKKVKLDGFIIGDDYRDDPQHSNFGVWLAVKRLVSEGRLKLLVEGAARQFVASVTP